MLIWVMWILFFSSLSWVFYTYVGYPVLIGVRSKFAVPLARQSLADEALPTISLVMAVHNGAEYIDAKLGNVHEEFEYPKELLEWIIVDDGSTDATSEKIHSYGGDLVKLVSLAERKGKPTALNVGVSVATGELLVFCDVRQRVDAFALRALASHFVEPTVGVVSGCLQMETSQGPGLYWHYERAIRLAESRLGCCVGATGALFAMRREQYREIPADSLLDDVFTPMQLALQGFSIHMDASARMYDCESDIDREFSRKVRTLAGNFQLLEHLPSLLSPRANPLFFAFVSHKMMRLLAPYALICLLVSNAFLLWSAKGLYWWSLGIGAFLFVQLCCYGLASLELLWGRGGRFGRVCKTFLVLNAAAVVAAKRAMRKQWRWS